MPDPKKADENVLENYIPEENEVELNRQLLPEEPDILEGYELDRACAKPS